MIPGNIWVAMTKNWAELLPRNLNREIAYAAGSVIISPPMAVPNPSPKEIINELENDGPSVLRINTTLE